MLREVAPHFFELRQSLESAEASNSAKTRLNLRESVMDEDDTLK